MLSDDINTRNFYDYLVIEVEPVLIKEMVLDVLKDLKKSLKQLVHLSPKSVEYKLLLFDIQRKVEEAKMIVDALIGELSNTIFSNNDDFFSLENNIRTNINELIRMVEITENKMHGDNLLEALALFIALYEEIINNFCDSCVFDAA